MLKITHVAVVQKSEVISDNIIKSALVQIMHRNGRLNRVLIYYTTF